MSSLAQMGLMTSGGEIRSLHERNPKHGVGERQAAPLRLSHMSCQKEKAHTFRRRVVRAANRKFGLIGNWPSRDQPTRRKQELSSFDPLLPAPRVPHDGYPRSGPSSSASQPPPSLALPSSGMPCMVCCMSRRITSSVLPVCWYTAICRSAPVPCLLSTSPRK